MTAPVHESVLKSIGNTPLVRIERINPNPKVELYAKLEGKNPGGSVKDRIALSMIEAAERSGELTRQKIVLEPTSGNTGIGLALVCAIRGYRLMLALPESVSVERRKILAALGAEFLLTPGHLGTDGAIETAYEMARENPERYFLPDQYNNPANVEAHYLGTGVEIWEQTGGRVTLFVAAMGTTGTLMGVSKRLRENNPQVRIVGVEPPLDHGIQGLKNLREAYVPGIFDKSLLDEKITVRDEEAFETARVLAREEGLFVGMSSGAAMCGALRKVLELDGGVAVVLLPDGGERYLSTPLFAGVGLTEKEHPARGRLVLYNTMTRQREPFRPAVEGKVSMYSCGPTVHARLHLGILRRFLATDLLKRVMTYRGLEVTHVMNITDIDDKTLEASERQEEPLAEFTRRNEEAFFRDIDALGVWRATHYPRASEHVQDMIGFTQKLIDAGFAYQKQRSVYFDISKFAGYGKLSRINLSKIKVGSTVDLDEYEKDNPRDFTLFKRCNLSEIKRGVGFQTEWGSVRPGWHVECAAIATKYLGESFDVHTSGLDLIFPHHENEIAQVEALSQQPLARTWFHSELVYVEGRKMSRSGQTEVTLPDLLDKGYTARAIRYYLLSVHYRQPLHFSFEGLSAAATALSRLDAFAMALMEIAREGGPGEAARWAAEALERFEEFMDADLNVGRALASVFELIRRVNPLLAEQRLCRGDARALLDFLASINRILGVVNLEREETDDEVGRLIAQREQARSEGNFEKADALRERVREMGFEIQDTAQGPRKVPRG